MEKKFQGVSLENSLENIFELKRTRLMRPNSLKVILWLVSLGIAMLYLITKPTKHITQHSKKQTSWLRQAYEQLQQAYGLLLWGGGLK